jgi:hypothetical protein
MPLGALIEFLKRGPEQALQTAPAGSPALAGSLRASRT